MAFSKKGDAEPDGSPSSATQDTEALGPAERGPAAPGSARAALVTGSSRGLGRGIALELAKGGYSVAIHYSGNEAAAAETKALCEAAAGIGSDARFEVFQADISDLRQAARLVEEVFTRFGQIDALVNNAGIAPKVRADIIDASPVSFDQLIATNVRGPYFLTQAVARRWLAGGTAQGRAVVFVTSISAETASVNRGDYCVSKAALSMAAKLWAARLAPEGVQVCELRPGIMLTDMTSGVKAKYDALLESGLVPQGRWGLPSDVGRAVRAIVDGAFPFSAGAVIDVDGGFHISRL